MFSGSSLVPLAFPTGMFPAGIRGCGAGMLGCLWTVERLEEILMISWGRGQREKGRPQQVFFYRARD